MFRLRGAAEIAAVQDRAMPAFEAAAEAVIRAIPPGEVVTYGEIAAEAGYPGAARAVGGLLAKSDGLPWWRVVAANGRLVPGYEEEHARRLRAEGVEVDGGWVRMASRSTGRAGEAPAASPRGRARR